MKQLLLTLTAVLCISFSYAQNQNQGIGQQDRPQPMTAKQMTTNMVKKLNEKGISDIIIIDSYGDDKMKNLLGLKFRDFVDYQDGLKAVGESVEKPLDYYEKIWYN